MPDDRRRNGQDLPQLRPEPVVIPLPRQTRKPPEQIARPVMPGWASDPQFRRLMVDPLLQLIASANFSAEQTVENTAQLLTVSKGVNELAEEVHKVGVIVLSLKKRLDGPEIEQRARAESSSQIDEATRKVERAAEALDDAVEEIRTSPGVQHDSDRIRAVATEAAQHVITERELTGYRKAADENRKLRTGIKITVFSSLILIGIVGLIAHLAGRSSGFAEGAKMYAPPEAATLLDTPPPVPPATASSGTHR